MSESSLNYSILKLLGQGQFGRVFLARHQQTGELVALKQLEKRQISTKVFLREVSFLVQLRHPNLVAFRGLEHSKNERYLVLDYCDGGNLRDVLNADSSLSLVQRLRLVADVLRGLNYLHNLQIIHRDMKPENILLCSHGNGWQARIADFGVARLLQNKNQRAMERGDTGSPAYMAPERFYGQYSIASDLYAVGILLYELVVGQRPFSGNHKEISYAHLNQVVNLPPMVPFPLRNTITASLQKLPGKRFNNALEMLKSLQLSIEILAATQSTASSSTSAMVRPS